MGVSVGFLVTGFERVLPECPPDPSRCTSGPCPVPDLLTFRTEIPVPLNYY